VIGAHTRFARPAASVLGASVLGVSALLAGHAGPAAAAPANARPAVYALDDHGRVLLPGAQVHPGQRLTVIGTGFRRRASIQVVDVARRAQAHVRADVAGVARTRFLVPRAAGASAVVDLAGPIAGGSGTTGRGTVTVTVPVVRAFSFTVRPGRGIDAVHTDAPVAGQGASSAGLATTGIDVPVLVLLGVGAVAAGALLTRRRA
jgi:hypothetical protein